MSLFERRKPDISTAYDRYADQLYRLSLSYLQNREDAQDAVQDVFSRYLTSAPVFRDAGHERAWLFRVTVNRCCDLLRRRKIRAYIPLEEAEPIADSAGDTEQTIDLMHTLSCIPEKYRAAVILHYLEGYSVQETADMLSISVSAAKMRLARGREALKGTGE